MFALTTGPWNAYVSSILKLNFNNDRTADGRQPDGRQPAGDLVSLAKLDPGETAEIVEIETDTRLGRRLGDLGFLPGTLVRTLSRAPLGDPTVYELRGSRFCLRESEARRVRVERMTAPNDD